MTHMHTLTLFVVVVLDIKSLKVQKLLLASNSTNVVNANLEKSGILQKAYHTS